MARRKLATSAKPDLRITVDKEVFDLLQENKINMLLSWKPQEKKPEVMEVITAHETDSLMVQCTRMDTVGFGYRPLGYPQHIYARGKTTRFHVSPLEAAEPAEQPETQTE